MVSSGLCSGRWHAWFGITHQRVGKVLQGVLCALNGRPDFAHKLVTYRGVHPPANALPPDVRLSIENHILERTRCDPEKKQLKAIDVSMPSNRGLYRGFIRHLAGSSNTPSEKTFRRKRHGLLKSLGMKKLKIVGFRCVAPAQCSAQCSVATLL